MYFINSWRLAVGGWLETAMFRRLSIKMFLFLGLCLFSANNLFSQLLEQKKTFTRADTLRGSLRPERTCYDVQFYELKVKVDTVNKSISGSFCICYPKVTEGFFHTLLE